MNPMKRRQERRVSFFVKNLWNILTFQLNLNLEKTNDVSDLIYDFSNRRSNSREREFKALEKET